MWRRYDRENDSCFRSEEEDRNRGWLEAAAAAAVDACEINQLIG